MPNQRSAAPVRKVQAVGLAGAVSAILIWIISETTKIVIPPEIASAITTVVSVLVGYVVPAAGGE